MISYDQYENRIKKYAKFKNFMKRFKFLFIGIFALIIATIATLLAVKGAFSGTIKIANSVYGDPYDDPEGVSAFMSSVSYEYAREGSGEWSTEKPVKAGKYSVRAVSNKTIGKSYGKTSSFEIEKRPVTFTVISDSVEYGSVPEEISMELVTGDKLDKEALLFVYDDYAAKKTGIDLDENSVKITNMNGTDDRSSCYTVLHEKKELAIEERSIEISLKREDFIYSGNSVNYPKAASYTTEVRLANGDIIEFGSVNITGEDTEAKFVGTYKAQADDFRIYKIIDGKKWDVTEQYKADTYSTEFQIKPESFTVKTGSAVKEEYDGEELFEKSFIYVTKPLAGDFLEVLESTSIKDAKSVENEFTDYVIKNGAGVDLTKNYEVKFEYGTLTIKPREITVTSPSNEEPWVYDGKWYSITEINCTDSLFKVRANSSKTVMFADTYQNEVEFDVLNSAGDIVAKSNFKITANWGTLEIKRRKITVKIEDAEGEYNGQPFYAPLDKVKVISDTQLVAGDEFLNDTAGWAFIIDAEAGVPNQSEYKIFCGGEDRTENYEITYNRGTLTVNPIHITLTTRSAQFVYDGQLHSAADKCKVFSGETETTLFKGNELIVDSCTELRNVSETENKCKYSVSTKNYIIDSVTYGMIKVVPRTLIVETNSNTYVYDGKAHSDGGYKTSYIGEGGLVEVGLIGNDKLALKGSAPSVTNVSTVENRCEYDVPNGNYIITYKYGALVVTPRPITVVTKPAKRVYTGEPLSNDKYTTYYIDKEGKEQDGLLNGDELILQELYKITNVDESGDNKCVFSVPNANYEIIDYDYGTISIMPRPLVVATKSAEKVYDGTPLSNDKYTTYYASKEISGLLGGDELILQKLIKITNVKDSCENKCEFIVPDNNYEILKYEYGTLTITPKPVVVKALTVTSIYGEDYKEAQYPTDAGNYESDDGFVGEDETVKLTVEFDLSKYKSEIKDMSRVPVKWIDGEVGGYKGAVKIIKWEFIGGDIRNYDITTEDGTLRIERRVLTVSMKDVTTFYGEELYKGEEVVEGIRASAVYPEGRGNVDGVYPNVGNTTSYNQDGLLEGDEIEIKYIHYLNTPSNSTSDKEDGEEEGEDKKDWEKTYVDPKDAKSYYIKPYEIWIYPVGGATEVTTDSDSGDCEGNYLIRYYVPGILKIKPRPIEVTLSEIAEECYDGEVRAYETGKEKITLAIDKVSASEAAYLKNRDMVLAYGEKLSVEVIFDRLPKYAGEYSYAFDEENSAIKVNGEVVEGGLKNYSITCKEGTLTITKRPITIKLHDLNLLYGEYVKYPDGEFFDITSELSLVMGDVIDAMTIDFGYETDKKVSVGKYTISVTNTIIKNDDGLELDDYGSVTNSYDIKYIDGKLTVDKKTLSVTVYPTSLKYGDKIDLTQPTISPLPLPYEELMTFDFAYFKDNKLIAAPRNVGDYDVKVIPKIDGDEEGISNYEISYFDEKGNSLSNATLINGLVIEKLPIKFTVKNQAITYGETMKEVEIDLDTPIPYADEKLTLASVIYKKGSTTAVVPKYFGEYVIRVEKLFINDEVVFINGGEEIDCNYAFSCDNDGVLNVEKREVKVKFKTLEVVYGNPVKYEEGETVYEFKEGSLAYQDKLLVTPIFVLNGTDADRPDWGAYPITEDESKRSVLNGEDKATDGEYTIAESYVITVDDSELTVKRREISVTLNQIMQTPSIYYDGQAHNYVAGGEVIGGMGMAYNEELSVAVKYTYTSAYPALSSFTEEEVKGVGKAGRYTYSFDSENSSVTNGGEKGIDNYKISSESRSFTIMCRPITVYVLKLEDRVYGSSVSYPSGVGNYQSVEAQSSGGGLLNNEYLEIFVYFKNTKTGKEYAVDSVLPAGSYRVCGYGAEDDLHKPVVTGGEFADICNYNITYEFTSFSVTKRSVSVAALDVTVDYGEAIIYEKEAGNYKEIGEDGLAEGETLTVSEVRFVAMPEKASVGTYVIQIVDFIIARNDGEVVTDNYEIKDLVDGLLTIEKRQIRVTTGSFDFVYDGDAHDTRELEDSFTIEYVKDATKDGLVYGDIGGYEDENSLPFVTEYRADKVKNEFNIAIMRNRVDVSGNYDIVYNCGYLSILKRKLYVTTMSAEKVYDGNPLTVPDEIQECYSYLNNDSSLGEEGKTTGLVKGHVFTFKEGVVTITDAGVAYNDTIKDIVESKTSSVSKMFNYEIVKATLGTLTIHKRVIYVDWSYNDKEVYDDWVYDGETHYSPDGGIYTVSFYDDVEKVWKTGEENVLASGQIFITERVSITNAGTRDNNQYVGVKIEDSGEVTSDNYDIISRSGKLTVKKRPVSVETDSYQMTYCNKGPQINIGYRVQYEDEEEGRGLLYSDDQIEIKVIYVKDGEKITRFNAGEYQVKLEFLNDNGNYDYDYKETGILTIDRVQLTLQPKSKTAQYGTVGYIETTAAEIEIIRTLADGETSNKLVADDAIVSVTLNRTTLSVNDNKSYLSIKIVKGSVLIKDTLTKEETTDNYDITLVLGSLEFTTRTIYFKQIIPDEMNKDPLTGRGVLSYAGAKQPITSANALFEILNFADAQKSGYEGDADTYGLAEGDVAAVKNASVGKQPDVYSQWLTLKVENGEGLRTKLYDIRLSTYYGDTSIEVRHVGVSVNLTLTKDIKDAALSDGETILLNPETDYQAEVSSEDDFLAKTGYHLQIGVYREGDTYTICVFIYELRASGKPTDRSSIFKVFGQSGIEEVDVTLVGMEFYPTGAQTGVQGE